MGEHDTYTDFDDAISEHLFGFNYIWCRSRVVLCYRAPGPQNLRIELCWERSSFDGSISVMTKSESTSSGRSSDGAGVYGDRRLRIVCLLIKFAQGNFIILDVLWRLLRWHRLSQLEVTLFEWDYDKIFHSFGDDLEAQVAQGAFRKDVILGFQFATADRPEVIVELEAL